ncbi:MAG: restriction endonuclease subunit S [Verrucomicrobia bacterium]|nr:restriction endonuclease subunit S [Verrucomicrobiota bacterium]
MIGSIANIETETQGAKPWPVVRLGDVAKTSSGGTPNRTSPSYYGGGIPWVKSGELGDSTVYETSETISEEGLKNSSAKIFPKGTLCVALYGATVGKLGILGMDAATNQAVCGIFLPPHIDTRFVYRFLEHKRRDLIDMAKGGAQPNISQDIIRNLEIPLPPLPEQRRIVAEIEQQFTRLDAGVAALHRTQANLKRYRAAVLKAACEGRLVPTEAELPLQRGLQGSTPTGDFDSPSQSKLLRVHYSPPSSSTNFETGEALLARVLNERRKSWHGRGSYKEPTALDSEKLFKLPEGWAWATLDSLADVKGGITKDQKRKHTVPARSVPYLRVANVQRGYIDLTEVKEIVATEDDIRELTLKPGDILFNEGGDRDKLGRGWVWNGELPECIHQNHVFRARLYITDLSSKLISWYANTFGQKFFFDEGKHTTNLASISMTKLKRLPVPIPPSTEKTRIVAEVERRLSVIDELESVVKANLQRSTRLRQSILQTALQPSINIL